MDIDEMQVKYGMTKLKFAYDFGYVSAYVTKCHNESRYDDRIDDGLHEYDVIRSLI